MASVGVIHDFECTHPFGENLISPRSLTINTHLYLPPPSSPHLLLHLHFPLILPILPVLTMTPVPDNVTFNSPEQDFHEGAPGSGAAANPGDVERVKSQWGEDLNTAFAYDKYADRGTDATWAASALRYEWSEETDADTVAPRDEALEKILFGDDGEGNMGINFSKYLSS